MVEARRLSMLRLLILVGCLTGSLLLTVPLSCTSTPVPAAVATLPSSPTPSPTPTATGTPTPTCTPLPTATPTATPVPVPVQVLRTYPIDDDTDLKPDAPLRIVFNQPMDPDPAALALSVTPALQLQAEWSAPDTLAVRTGPRQAGAQYHLTLGQAHGRSGGTLQRPLALTFGQGGKGAPIPILMYHHVDALPAGATAAAKEWMVSPEAFAAQLDLLTSVGAHVVPLGDVVNYLDQGAPLPARPAVLTFDDGNKCMLTNVLPVLRARQMPAIFFVPSQYASSGNPNFLNWDGLKALVQAGYALGGHSYAHAYVDNLTAAEAEHQFGDDMLKIQEQTGYKIEFLAYPFGRYSAQTIEQVKHHGYRAALTIEQDPYQKPSRLFQMGRIRVGYEDPLDRLRSKLPWRD